MLVKSNSVTLGQQRVLKPTPIYNFCKRQLTFKKSVHLLKNSFSKSGRFITESIFKMT